MEKTPIDISSFPELVADFMGIPELAAGLLIAGFITVCAFALFAMVGKPTANVVFIVGMTIMGFCIVMAWLPVWFFGIIVLGIAFNIAGKLRRYIS